MDTNFWSWRCTVYLWTAAYRLYLVLQHFCSEILIFCGKFGKPLKCLHSGAILVKCLCYGVILVWHIVFCHAPVKCFVLVQWLLSVLFLWQYLFLLNTLFFKFTFHVINWILDLTLSFYFLLHRIFFIILIILKTFFSWTVLFVLVSIQFRVFVHILEGQW